MTHDITFEGSTTITCFLKWNWKLTLTHAQKDNSSDIECFYASQIHGV